MIIGIISGLVGYWSVEKLKKMINRLDDTLDVFGLHGVVGLWGAFATGIFTSPTIHRTGE